MSREYKSITHPFEPIWDNNSEILILGTMASVSSRESGFYYGHPKNKFWTVIADITKNAVPVTADEKRGLLLRNRIALWDVVKSCEITGSDDNSIRNVIANDLSEIFEYSKIEKIYTNGRKADALYKKYLKTGIESICLPSTSPANAAWNTERLTEAWRDAIAFIQKK